jgi:hypothetical protein
VLRSPDADAYGWGNRLRCAHDVRMIGICRPTEAE